VGGPLVSNARPGHHALVTSDRQARDDRTLKILLVLTVLCYAIGYPVALAGHSFLGWVLVFLGGPLLIAVLVLVIRRVQR
jgi:hypothetical protein